MKNKIYIIGDVHGCFKTLQALINKLPKDANICFVGDLCDRGSDSKEVIEFIKSNAYDSVLGNHELMFVYGVEEILNINKREDFVISYWLDKCGGKETLESYKNDNKTLEEHLNYIKSLPSYKEYKDIKTDDERYLVVSHSHVGSKWQYRDYPMNSKEYSSFQKEIFYSRYKDFDNKDIFNVFGHTVTQEPIITPHKASIDLGCVYNQEGKVDGKLCALEFTSLKTIVQKYIG